MQGMSEDEALRGALANVITDARQLCSSHNIVLISRRA
jgi:hypothetical protein